MSGAHRQPENLLELLLFALDAYPEQCFLADARAHLLGSTRPSGGRPATVTLAVPDGLAAALRGPADKARYRVLLFAVKAEAVARAESRIVLPGEAAARPRKR